MKKVVFRYKKEEPRFGGPSCHELSFICGDMVMEDVDIVKQDGTLEHGFRFENQFTVSFPLSKVADVDDLINKLKMTISELRKKYKD